MGIYDREYIRDDTPGFLLGGRSMVMNLIIINVGVFILDAIFAGAPGHPGQVSEFLALRSVNIREPWYWWRLLTYGFAHASPPHIIGNMFGLFFFGRNIETLYGPKKFLGMYLTAIVLGGLCWSIPAMFVNSPILLGASCAITAIILLFCFHFPKVTVLFMMFIPMPAWVLGVILILADLTGRMGGNADGVAHGVHLIGAAYGYLFYTTQFELGQLFSGRWFSQIRSGLRRKPQLRVHDPGVSEFADDLERRADQVLDKLYREGESSLTGAERKILEDYSRRLKQKNR